MSKMSELHAELDGQPEPLDREDMEGVPDDIRICGNCVYHDGAQCRRYPPTYERLGEGRGVMAKLPRAAYDGWCGEWRGPRSQFPNLYGRKPA